MYENLYHSSAFFFLVLVKPNASAQIITTLAGTSQAGYNGDSIPASNARVNLPVCARPDIFGNIFFTDRQNHRLRKIDTNTGLISTVAGNGIAGYSGDGGQAIQAQLNNPAGLAILDDGTIFISEISNHRIRKIAPSGVITTYAGNGFAGFIGDGGIATAASFNTPWGLALDASNNLYVADRANNRIRKIDFVTGLVSTVAGNGASGFAGDGGLATSAVLNKPISLALSQIGDILIADEDNHRVRLVNNITGLITTIAGTGTAGFNGNGIPATTARLNFPSGVGFDNSGNIYISDRTNQRVRKIDSSGNISTVAGTGTIGFSGDGGNATSAQLNYPRELFSDGSGNIYIADTDNNRIRKVTFCSLPDVPVLAATQTVICAGETTSLSISSGNLNQASSWEWYEQSCGGIPIGAGTNLPVSPTVTTTYYVRGEGGCSTPYGCATITVTVNAAPAIPGTIIGDTEICAGSTEVYSVQPINGASSYQWLIPATWNGNSLSESITLTTGTISDSIGIFALNACGSSDTSILAINILQIPDQPSAISGANQVCANSENTYFVVPGSSANTYSWTTPTGWLSLPAADSIVVIPGSTSGSLSVVASNACGSSPTQSIQVNVTAFETGITDFGLYISSNDSNSSYQWIDCATNSIIQGASNRDYFPTLNGTYAVILSQNGCTDTSVCFSYLTVSIQNSSTHSLVKCYPSNTDEMLTIEANIERSGSILQIYDPSGKLVQQHMLQSVNTKLFVGDLKPGIYLIRFSDTPHKLKFLKK